MRAVSTSPSSNAVKATTQGFGSGAGADNDSAPEKRKNKKTGKIVAFFLAFAALAAVLFLPMDTLDRPGQIALAMLAFAVIMWVSEAVTYPVSSVLILGLISLLLGFSPVSYTHLTLPTIYSV